MTKENCLKKFTLYSGLKKQESELNNRKHYTHTYYRKLCKINTKIKHTKYTNIIIYSTTQFG